MLQTIVIDAGIALACVLSGVAGWQVCRSTHRQRGLEADDFAVVVPDRPGDRAGV